MNSQPPGGQTAAYPRVMLDVEPKQLVRWKRLQTSQAKIVAYMVADHIYGSLRVRALRDRLTVSDALARDFVAWELDDLTLDFQASSFVESFHVLGKAYGVLRKTASVHTPLIGEDDLAHFCTTVALACRRDFFAPTAAVLGHHAKARESRRHQDLAKEVERAVEAADAAREGIMRAMRNIRKLIEGMYMQAVTAVSQDVARKPPVDWRRPCAAHLQSFSRRVRDALTAQPTLREELLALELDPETRKLIDLCDTRDSAPISTRTPTLKMAAWRPAQL